MTAVLLLEVVAAMAATPLLPLATATHPAGIWTFSSSSSPGSNEVITASGTAQMFFAAEANCESGSHGGPKPGHDYTCVQITGSGAAAMHDPYPAHQEEESPRLLEGRASGQLAHMAPGACEWIYPPQTGCQYTDTDPHTGLPQHYHWHQENGESHCQPGVVTGEFDGTTEPAVGNYGACATYNFVS